MLKFSKNQKTNSQSRSVVTALIVCLLAITSNVQAQQDGKWIATGSLSTGRDSHTATILANGKVLVVGGYVRSSPSGVTELYDPATGQWSVSGSLIKPRGWHTAVRLDNGKVLVTGGWSGAIYYNTEITSEIYDPDTGEWRTAGSLGFARAGHRAALLADGRVLVTGGSTCGYWGGGPTTAELYDPATDAWSPAGTMNSPRDLHTSTLLPDGRVLVAGGINNAPVRSAELYDPATGRWTATGDLITPRVFHTATLLPNGNVLVAGGGLDDYPWNHTDGKDKAELYDPATGRWTATGSLIASRAAHTATLLPNGRVLAAGGFNDAKTGSSAELYDPATANWTTSANLITGRESPTATLLTNGKVLVAGGNSSSGYPRSAELYDPGVETTLLTLNSTRYCTGDPWNLRVISSPNALIQLAGISNGSAWEVSDWRKTDTNGNLSETGTFATVAEGAHSLHVDIGGEASNTASFNVASCQIRLALNSSDYCTGAIWNLKVDSDFPNASISLSGSTNGEAWELANWLTTGVDGKGTVDGAFVEGNEGVHNLRVRIGAVQSNLFSFRVSRCRP